TAHYRLSLAGLQRQNFDARLLPVRLRVVRREQDGLSPRQDLRPAVGEFAVFEFGERLRRSAVLGNARKSRAVAKRRDNEAILAPGPTVKSAAITQRHRWPPVDRDLFQFAAGAECDPFAIGRKEGVISPFGPR